MITCWCPSNLSMQCFCCNGREFCPVRLFSLFAKRKVRRRWVLISCDNKIFRVLCWITTQVEKDCTEGLKLNVLTIHFASANLSLHEESIPRSNHTLNVYFLPSRCGLEAAALLSFKTECMFLQYSITTYSLYKAENFCSQYHSLNFKCFSFLLLQWL